jgi:hypothetical protein
MSKVVTLRRSSSFSVRAAALAPLSDGPSLPVEKARRSDGVRAARRAAERQVEIACILDPEHEQFLANLKLPFTIILCS